MSQKIATLKFSKCRTLSKPSHWSLHFFHVSHILAGTTNQRFKREQYHHHQHHHHHSFNREGRWGTTYDFATTFLHFSLFSTALWDLPNSRPVHSLMLSSYLFPCLPCLLPPFTVPCLRWFWPDLMNGRRDHAWPNYQFAMKAEQMGFKNIREV